MRQALIGLKERGATVVIIAHRPSVLSAVDKLLVLRDGMIETFGPREEVLPKVTRAVPSPSPEPAGSRRASAAKEKAR